jgi:hypothetical protein
MLTTNSCRQCGATSYRRVIERDQSGAMQAGRLYRCSGCSVVFADPLSWREGERGNSPGDPLPAPPALTPEERTPQPRSAASATSPRAPDLRTYGIAPDRGTDRR